MIAGKRIVSSRWFTNLFGCVGIVVVDDLITGERKAFIGTGQGENEQVDIDYICEWGKELHAPTLWEIERELSKGINTRYREVI